MYDIALSATDHDFIVTDGDIMLIDNAERVAQQIKIQLKWILGEWFLDTTGGMPYLESILVKNPNIALIRNIFRRKILEVDDVTAVASLELVIDKRQRILTVSYKAETTYGLVTRREVLGYGNQ